MPLSSYGIYAVYILSDSSSVCVRRRHNKSKTEWRPDSCDLPRPLRKDSDSTPDPDRDPDPDPVADRNPATDPKNLCLTQSFSLGIVIA